MRYSILYSIYYAYGKSGTLGFPSGGRALILQTSFVGAHKIPTISAGGNVLLLCGAVSWLLQRLCASMQYSMILDFKFASVRTISQTNIYTHTQTDMPNKYLYTYISDPHAA